MKNAIVLLMLSAAVAAAQTASVEMISTPEPGTMALLGLGLVGFGILSVRRAKRSK